MASTRNYRPWRACLLVSALLVVSAAGKAQAATLIVASNGIDSGTCGTMTAPCRSITQAITRAAAGDTIVVGPGRYGDLNNNGTFGETGEEPAQIGSGCGCMVDVTKKLTITSRDGAASTVIDATGAAVTAVLIDTAAGGSVFGKSSKGFSLTGGSGVVGLTVNATGVTVAGNISSHNDFGFRADADNSVFNNNRAEGNSFQGIFVTKTSTITGNVVAGSVQNGIWLAGGGPHVVKGNVSTGNRGDGFVVDNVSAPGTLLLQNAAIANGGSGIHITSTGSATVNNSSMFGNGTSSGANCGLTNDAGVSIDATKNFWGAAGGPGVDPADAVCGSAAGSVLVTPLQTKEIKVAIKAIK